MCQPYLQNALSHHFQYDYVELTRDVLNGDPFDEEASKYSADRGSPIEPHEKAFSSTDDGSKARP